MSILPATNNNKVYFVLKFLGTLSDLKEPILNYNFLLKESFFETQIVIKHNSRIPIQKSQNSSNESNPIFLSLARNYSLGILG